MANVDGVITEADVRSAQTFLDNLRGQALEELELRGALAGVMAEVRTAGYLEGVQRGRQEAAHVVLDALQGEGLFTTSTRAGEGW